MAYATVAKIKEYLGIPALVVTDDTMLGEFLDVATERINEFTGINYENTFTTKYFDTPVNPMVLILVPEELVAVTAVTNGDGTAISSSDYDLYPYNEEVKREIRIKPTAATSYFKPKDGYNPHRAIAVQGNWGNLAVPTKIRQATIETVAWMYRSRFGDAGEVQLTTSGGIMRVPSGLPEAVKEMLVGDRRLF